jgi:hypothetical protein
MYRTFLRSARNWQEFSSNPKIEVDTGLTLTEARRQCEEYNAERSESEIEAGTKMEFEEE